MPVCTKCNVEKPEDQFHNRRRRDGTLAKRRDCASCNYASQRIAAAKRPDEYRRVRQRYWEHRRLTGKNLKYLSDRYAFIEEAKKNPCTDCRQTYPVECMDFDHVRGEKRFGIGTAKGACKSVQAVLEEMAKCELVCSNCHRIRTRKRATESRRARYESKFGSDSETD